jgi:phosphate transport system substrate-binding protein
VFHFPKLLKGLVAAVATTLIGSTLVGLPAQAEPIRGAGSTFAAPIITKWAQSYKEARADGGDFISPDWLLDYEIVGSMAGIMRLGQPELDFAATDVPLPAVLRLLPISTALRPVPCV